MVQSVSLGANAEGRHLAQWDQHRVAFVEGARRRSFSAFLVCCSAYTLASIIVTQLNLFLRDFPSLTASRIHSVQLPSI